MRRDGEATHERILDAAEALILEHGYGGTSVDRVIEAAGLTKGAFFYHFKSKADLARALVERFARLDREQFERNMARAQAITRDPLQQMLVFVGLFVELMERLEEPYPGCLFASYVYQRGLMDPEALGIVQSSLRFWRARLAERFREIMERHPPRIEVDPESLADAFTVIIEGAFLLSRSLDEARVVADQLRHYRNYLELLFSR